MEGLLLDLLQHRALCCLNSPAMPPTRNVTSYFCESRWMKGCSHCPVPYYVRSFIDDWFKWSFDA
jgi:hypothetical protein